MSRFFAALGRFVVHWRWPIAVVWVVVTIVMTATLPSLASVAKDTQSGFLPSNSPSIAAENMTSAFHNINYASGTIVASRSDGPLTAADQAAISRLITRVTDTPHTKAVAYQGTSRDGEAEQLAVQADVPQYGTGDAPAYVQQVRSEFSQVGAPTGLEFHFAGTLGTIVDEVTASHHSQSDTQLFSVIFIILLLLVAFRALLAPLVTLIPAFLVVTLSSPVIALATHIGVQASSITQLILVVLVLGAGTDYGLFLVFRTREEMRRGLSNHDAVARAVATVGESITFSALIVMAALLSLLIAQFGFYQSLGPALAIGIGLMLLAGLTLLPALLAILGRAVFWPSSVRPVEVIRHGTWSRIANRLIRRPLLTLIGGLVIFIALAVGYVGAPTAGFADQTTPPAGSDAAAGAAVISAHFPAAGIFPTELLFRFQSPIWDHTGTLETLATGLQASGDYSRISSALDPAGISLTPLQLSALHSTLGEPGALPPQPSPADLSKLLAICQKQPVCAQAVESAGSASPALAGLYNAYRATSQFISPDGRTVQLIAIPHLNDSSNPTDVNYTPTLRQHVATVAQSAGAVQNGVFSITALAYDVSSISNSDLLRIIPIVTIVIAILLGIVLRSIGAPLYLVPSVVLSYLAALGFVALVFVHLGGQSGVQFVLPFLMFIFLMALGSDYNVLVMTRIREERHRLPLREAVTAAIGATGTTVTTAGTVLGGTFAVLALAGSGSTGGTQIEQIGYGIALGVLLDTFLVRTVIVPSIVVLLGRVNWWPSRLWKAPVDQPAD